MNYGALIPLRAGSKGIKNKNIKLLNGKPLCEYVLEACLQSKNIDQIYVSTDSFEISKVVQSLSESIQIINRPKELASDFASTESVMLHALDMMNVKNVVLLQATSPLTRFNHIDEAIDLHIKEDYDSILSVVKSEKFIWNKKLEAINYDYMNRSRRQDLKGYYVETGSFYISRKDSILKNKCRISGKIGPYVLPLENIHEIDTAEDWCIIEKLLS